MRTATRLVSLVAKMVAATRPNLKVSASRFVGKLQQQQQQLTRTANNDNHDDQDTETKIKVNNRLAMLDRSSKFVEIAKSNESNNNVKQQQTLQDDDNNSVVTTREERNQTPPPPKDWQLEQKYTLSEVQQHASLDDCWMVIFDKVYNITDFVYEHPGGDYILLEYAGRDATHPFLSSRHGSSAYKMLDKYWIGILVDEELYYSNNSSYCSVYSNLSWRSTPTLEENVS